MEPRTAQAAQAGQDDWPDTLVEPPLREGFPAPLPLNAGGSAPEHPESVAGPITDPLMCLWSEGLKAFAVDYVSRR